MIVAVLDRTSSFRHFVDTTRTNAKMILCRRNDRAGAIAIGFIAKYSFGIYPIQCFWLNILNKGLYIYPSAFPLVVGEFGVFAVVLAALMVSSMVMYRLLGFRKILR